MRRAVILVIALAVLLAALGVGTYFALPALKKTQAPGPAQSGAIYGRIVIDRARGQAKLVKSDGTTVELGPGTFGQVDARGNALVGDWETGLRRYDAKTGQLTQLKGPHEIGAPFYLDASGRYLAYQSIQDYNGDQYLTSGVGVLDLRTGRDQVVCVRSHQYAHGVAWVSERVLILSWDDGQVSYPVFKLVDFDGREERLTALQKAPYATGIPVPSADQHHLYYRSKNGVVLINPAAQTFQIYEGADNVYWTKGKLVVITGDDLQMINPYSVLPMPPTSRPSLGRLVATLLRSIRDRIAP